MPLAATGQTCVQKAGGSDPGPRMPLSLRPPYTPVRSPPCGAEGLGHVPEVTQEGGVADRPRLPAGECESCPGRTWVVAPCV